MIKKLVGEEIDRFCSLANRAFEGLHADKWLKENIEQATNEEMYGLLRGGKLVAGMRVFQFDVTFSSISIPMGGLGMLAVDMLHKKEKHALSLINEFFEISQQQNCHMVMLHPFRTDFYRKMGFGLGTLVHQLELPPRSFTNYKQKSHLEELTLKDRDDVFHCYNRVAAQTHGMTKRVYYERELNRPFQFGRLIGYKKNGQLLGYIAHSTAGGQIRIHEFFYENSEVLQEFSTYLYQQADQFDRIIVNDYGRELLYFVQSQESISGEMTEIPSAPGLNHLGNHGLGVMYRVINIHGLVADLKAKGHRFNDKTINVKISLQDDLLKHNNDSITLAIQDGEIVNLNEKHADVEISMEIGDFSSLLMGAVDFKALHKTGLANITDDTFIETINQLFSQDKPICTKAF
ncbi:GNAT family N-acetyltransferase [Salinibacillus xinjiangensis]|uniref:GNAT family N-acetyltransferase n=1 Tax=Salinibacillus xinjiangensis TaxID=1229268 RepID=UPI001891A46B|nr:GNAT family N-acetyltransferase [Salinibacillus xinjiangensis]